MTSLFLVRAGHRNPSRAFPGGFDGGIDEPDSVDTIRNVWHEKGIRVSGAVFPLCGDLFREVGIELREGFQISFRMATGYAGGVGGSASGAGTAASNGAPGFPERRKAEFVWI